MNVIPTVIGGERVVYCNTHFLAVKKRSKMHHLPVRETSANIPTLIEAAVRGEIIFIPTADQPLIRFGSLKQPKQPRQSDSAKRLIQMAEDFDAPLDDFREYLV